MKYLFAATSCALAIALAVIAFGSSGANGASKPTPLPARSAPLPPLERGIDRSNMAVEWSLSPPNEPKIYPFTGPYNGAGVFEARRIAVFDGMARLHVPWFRDGLGKDTPADATMFADTVKQVHARGMKILATIGPSGSDFDAGAYVSPAVSGCQWGAFPLSKIDLGKLRQRLVLHFDALKRAGEAPDAFELGNELDLYCNDADMPKESDFAAHHWKWYLSDDQVLAFVKGYVPFLTTSVALIREYFPHAQIITFGMGNPTGNSAPLIAALAHYTDDSGKTFDYTTLVNGYGSHIYPRSVTTLDMVTEATNELTNQAAMLPHIDEKPIWITEWNEAASAFWSTKRWYFQYDAAGAPGGDLNLADKNGTYPAMTRAQAITAFYDDVVDRLGTQADPVNIGYVFYYAYDGAGKSAMCDATGFDTQRGIKDYCYADAIDPTTGDLLPDVAAALSGTP